LLSAFSAEAAGSGDVAEGATASPSLLSAFSIEAAERGVGVGVYENDESPPSSAKPYLSSSVEKKGGRSHPYRGLGV